MDKIIADLNELSTCTEPSIVLDKLQEVHGFLTSSVIDYSKFEQFIYAAFPVDDKGEILGILCFLKRHIGEKPYEKSKIEALKILQCLLDNRLIRSLIWKFCKAIQKVATLIWENQRESSSTQQEALECIIITLENFRELVSPAEFELATLYGKLLPSSEKSIYSATVRGKMFHCLGIVSSFGANNFLQQEAKYLQLWNHFIYTLKCQVDSVNQHVEANILQGCIKGLDKFLEAYKTKISNDDPRLKDLFEKLEQIVDPKCSIDNDALTIKLKRREFQRSGLEFVSNHSTFLDSRLFRNHEQWFNDLLSWAKSSNADDSKVGMRAMLLFLESVCSFTSRLQKSLPSSQEYSHGDVDTIIKELLHFKKFFTETFKSILDKKDATKNERTIAVKGAGLLATICEDSGIIEELFSKMIRIIEGVIVELNMPVVDKYSGSHALLPTYLESAGNFLLAIEFSELETGSNANRNHIVSHSHNYESRLTVVENLSILLTISYPDLSEKYRYWAPLSFFKVIKGLYSRHQVYCEPFLTRVIHEGLTHVIASPTQVEADILIESYNRQNSNSTNSKATTTTSIYNRLGLRTVKFYTSFWIGLVNPKQINGVDKSEMDAIVNLIYNGILDWILKTIGKLDLSMEFVEDENENSENASIADPVYNAKAAVVKDFQLFVNIVDFLMEFLLKTDSKLFASWVDIFFDKILSYIQEHPLVSGFYRIMALVFELMRRLNHFELENVESENLLTLSSQFLHGLSLKIQEFRDDLLLAVLDVWLSAPNQLILQSCSSLGDTLLRVFRTGKNWLPLAQKGIAALERWFQVSEFPEDVMERLFNQLFPVLQSFFSAAESPEDGIEITETKAKQITNAKAALKSRNKRNKAGGVVSHQTRLLQAVEMELQETTLGKLQLNILNFFGSYGHLLDMDADNESDQIGFAVNGRCLKYVVPFQDIKPDLFLDDFIPRLFKLCHNSTDRQLRSSACEVFHSFTLYFLGYSAKNNSQTNLLDLFRRIFSTVLDLGSDSDIVIRQLFNPLSIQIIHWCSSKNNCFSESTLSTIIDGLVQSEDPSKRDFSGICLLEYFDWCLKHGNDSQAKQVLKFLISLSQHAALHFRQGSVLGFNSIYRIFRENSELVSQYTFLLMQAFLNCLNQSQSQDSEIHANSMIVLTVLQAVRHLERIIIKKKEAFNFVLVGRKVPSDFKGGTLHHLVEWLLEKSGNSFGFCRQQCFRLISAFCPFVKNISSVESFLDTLTPAELIAIAEKSFLSVSDTGEIDIAQALEVSSDVYAFLKNSQYSRVEMLLRNSTSKFAQSLEKFLKEFKIELKDMTRDKNKEEMEMDTEESVRDKTLFDFDFHGDSNPIVGLNGNDCTRALNIFCNIGCLENILSCKIQAHILVSSATLSIHGATRSLVEDSALADVFKNGKIIEAWMVFWRNLNSNNSSTSINIIDISKKLKRIFKIDLKSYYQDTQGVSVNHLKWIVMVAEKGFLAEIFTAKEIEGWVSEAFAFIDSQIFQEPKAKTLSPVVLLEEKIISNRTRNLVDAAFRLALALLGKNGGCVIDTIFHPLQIYTPNMSRKTTKGEVYQNRFIASIPYCSQVLDVCSLQRKIGMEKIGKFVQKLLVNVKNSKVERKRFGKIVVEKTVEIWEQLTLNCTNETIASLISGMASLNMDLCRQSVQLSNWWCGPSMMTCVNLSLPEKSNFIHFFGLFGLSENQEIVSNVITTLHRVLNESLNPQLISWKNDENFLLKILHAILKVFEEIPQNLDLLKLLALVLSRVSLLSSVDSNSCSSVVLKKIERVVPNVNNFKDQMKMADTVYECITSEGNEDYRHSMAVTKYILVPILACVGERASKEFFKKNINDISKNVAVSPKSSSDWFLKITALNLVEILCLLKTNTLFFTGPELNSVYLKRLNRTPNPADSKDCAKDLMKLCTSFISPSEARDEATKKLVYQSNQAAFSVLHAGLRVMGTPLKTVLSIAVRIVPSKTNKESWLNIIDSSLNFSFPVVVDPPKQTETDGNEVQTDTSGTSNVIKALGATNNRALRKTALACSSLAMDATNYDFTAAVTIENSKFYQRLLNNNKDGAGSSARSKLNSNSKLESNQLNEHPCMVPFVETLKNFFKKKNDPAHASIMQDLISTLNTLLRHYPQNQNVQIFLIGAILNCKEIFKDYAKDLKDGILKSILPPQPCFGPELNYIFKDVLVMLLEWQNSCHNEKILSSNQVLQLLDFILQNVWHDRKDVLIQHFEILEAVVKTWVSDSEAEMEIPLNKVAELVAQSENRLGLEVCKYILRGGQLPCVLNGNNISSFDLKKLFHAVNKTLGSTSKLTYGLGGEVIGLLFRHLEIKGFQSDLKNAVDYAQRVLNKERSKSQKLLIILNKIQSFYGAFVRLYKSSVMELLKTESVRGYALNLIPGILRCETEEIAGDSFKTKNCLEDFYVDLDCRRVFDNVWKNDSEIEAAVAILVEFMSNSGNFKDECRFVKMVQSAEKAADTITDSKLKVLYAKAVSTLYHSFGGRRDKSTLSKIAHKLFVRFQNDPSEDMKVIVADFWERNLKSWKDSPGLILELLDVLGDEKKSISICVDLIMKRCGLSPDFSKEIFPENVLGDCVFQKYDLDTSWRMRHSTFQPLYAESLSSSQNFSQFPKSVQLSVMSQRQTSRGGGGLNLLRATLNNLQFSLTAPNQSLLNDSSSNSSEPIDGNFDIGGSFNPDRFYSSFNYQNQPEGDNQDQNGDGSGRHGQVGQGSQDILGRLRRRFYDRPASQLSSTFFARRAIENQEAQVERKVEAIRSKRSGIKLIRSYRIGELPDTMMKNSDFLATISAMTKNDEETGKKFLVHLFTSILKEVQSTDSSKAKKLARNTVCTFEDILRKYGLTISPALGATILEIALVNGDCIPIQSELISKVAIPLDLQRLAILKLEKVLESSIENTNQNQDELEPQVKKLRLTVENPEDTCTVLNRIAQLYKDLEDFDAVRNVFRMAAEKTSDEHLSAHYIKGCDALKLESEGKFEEAADLYAELYDLENELDVDNDVFSDDRLWLWDGSAFTCLKQLSKWDEVYERAHKFVNINGPGYSTVFKNDDYLDHILPNHLTSAIQLLIRDEGTSNEDENQQCPEEGEDDDDGNEASFSITKQIRNFLSELQKQPIWDSLIEESIDLSILSVLYEHELGHTLSWMDKNIFRSLQNFQNLNRMTKLGRKDQMLTSQRTAVLQDYVDWQKKCRNLAGSNSLEDSIKMGTRDTISKWKHSGKPQTSFLFSADIVVAEKKYFLMEMGAYVKEQLEESNTETADFLFNELQVINFNQHLWLADLSIINHNHTVAWETFRKTKHIGCGLEEEYMVEFKRLLSHYLIAFTEEDDRWDRHWISAWNSLRKLEKSDELKSSFWEVKTNLVSSLFAKLSLGPLQDDHKIRKQLGIQPSANLIQHISKLATDLAKDVPESGDLRSASNATAFCVGSSIQMILYNLLKEIRRKCEKGLSNEHMADINSCMLTSLLRAMKNGEKESIRLFPTSFSILEKYPEFLSTFEEMVVDIPSRIFLPWLDQIVVNYRSNRVLRSVLNSIINRLIVDYPQAFQLQYTDLLLDRKKLPEVYALYLEALTAVTVPSRLIKEYLPKQITSNLELESSLRQLKGKLEEIRVKSHMYGDLHQNYVSVMLPIVVLQIQRLENANAFMESDSDSPNGEREVGSPSSPHDVNFLKNIVDSIRNASNKCEGKEPSSSLNIQLERFSPWLARFRSSRFQDYLEVPGLYNAFDTPNTTFHPKIVSFHPTVLQIQSLTKPIRITVLCDNGKEVRILVKKGDDLRQDKRIQQCFRVANEIFKADTHCRERRLQIRTYNVIPITNDFGLIEWIDKTVPLKRLILNSKSMEGVYGTQFAQYHKWISSFNRQKFERCVSSNPYHINAQFCGRAEAEKKYDECCNYMPRGLLREHIMAGCNSLEEYFTLREKIIRSYASMCYVHWLFGIGDRHLENSLISTETGELLGIDFGRSFGIAIFKQDIPELIPFRLTPQIQNFLQPYGYSGLFKDTMLRTQRAMKKSAELLIAVADVFIKEPLTDWLKIRDRDLIGSSNEQGGVVQEQPDRMETEANKIDNLDRIKILTFKLMGKNPISIIGQDIHKLKKPLRPIYLNILKDGKGELGLAQKLTDEEYVDMLIALATDKNILARLYVGWSSWL